MDKYGTKRSIFYPLKRRDLFLVQDNFGIQEFYMKDQPIWLEVGDKIKGGEREFKWKLKSHLPSDDDYGLLLKDEIKDKELLRTKDKEGATVNIGDDIKFDSPNKYDWALFLFDLDLGHQSRKDFIVSWVYRIFYGVSEKDQLTEEDIKQLNSELFTSYGKRYNYNVSGKEQYYYFIFPKDYGDSFAMVDIKTSISIDFNKTQEINITNDFGVTTTYNVFRTQYKQLEDTIGELIKE